ncbi:hypothetical protein CIT292_06015 [Citrobacter youngae ATCC 29220]|uniref:Uncharacterized protein n=1 Tax=Citrobacter youngae ATCC 29220 TaxID=500640 RepID=D4B6S6_9ENTR|nr:hypothetical protein CIT292_06015 [Citrobacter youngae ATCC 29220]
MMSGAVTQIPYRMVKCQAISHPVRNLNAGEITGKSDQRTSVCVGDVCCGWVNCWDSFLSWW